MPECPRSTTTELPRSRWEPAPRARARESVVRCLRRRQCQVPPLPWPKSVRAMYARSFRVLRSGVFLRPAYFYASPGVPLQRVRENSSLRCRTVAHSGVSPVQRHTPLQHLIEATCSLEPAEMRREANDGRAFGGGERPTHRRAKGALRLRLTVPELARYVRRTRTPAGARLRRDRRWDHVPLSAARCPKRRRRRCHDVPHRPLEARFAASRHPRP